MSLANSVLAVNNDLPIITDQKVHSGKVRSVYWLTAADSKRLIKKNGYKFQLNSFSEIILNAKIIFQKKTYQIKGRIFEITGAGGFLLTEKADFLEKYFNIGEEIVTFENYSELKDKIKFYLTNKDLRQEIARKGQDRILRDHTYSQRLNHIFNKIMKNSLDE